MLAFALIPLIVVATALAGFGLCAVAGVNPHTNVMVIAGTISLAASLLALIPLLLTRGSTQYGVAQASLVATIVHLFVTIAAATAVVMNKGGLPLAALYWLLAFYWATLAVLVVTCVRAVRHARAATPAGAAPKQ